MKHEIFLHYLLHGNDRLHPWPEAIKTSQFIFLNASAIALRSDAILGCHVLLVALSTVL